MMEFGEDVIDYECWDDTLAQAYILDERKDGHSTSLENLLIQHMGADS